MQYQTGKTRENNCCRFEDHEGCTWNLVSIAKRGHQGRCLFSCRRNAGRTNCVGRKQMRSLLSRFWKHLAKAMKVLGNGTIFWQNDEPKIHFHGAFGKKDLVKVGCLREKSETFLCWSCSHWNWRHYRTRELWPCFRDGAVEVVNPPRNLQRILIIILIAHCIQYFSYSRAFSQAPALIKSRMLSFLNITMQGFGIFGHYWIVCYRFPDLSSDHNWIQSPMSLP